MQKNKNFKALVSPQAPSQYTTRTTKKRAQARAHNQTSLLKPSFISFAQVNLYFIIETYSSHETCSSQALFHHPTI